MMDLSLLDRGPVIVAIAGPNGAGKTTFYRSQLTSSGLRFVNADVLADELQIAPYAAARVADALRRALVSRGESFIFETVFSDPAGEKVAFLEDAAHRGYVVVVCFVGLASPAQSVERVALRVSQGGHDVPDEKLSARFSGTLVNLRAAILRLPFVFVCDNSDLNHPFRRVLVADHGRLVERCDPLPDWLGTIGEVDS